MLSVLPTIEHLSPRIIRILGCNPGQMTLQGTNTYIIGNGQKRLLIDTGEPDNQTYISSLVGVLKEQRASLSDIIITHWHSDHIGGLCNVLEATNKEAVVYKYACPDAQHDPIPDWVQMRPLQHLKEVAVQGASLRAHYTPGHTTDHLSLELLGDGPDVGVFTGDCILGESTTVFEELYDYMNSLKVLLGISRGPLYPGHGPVIPDGPATIAHYIRHRMAREKQIFRALLAAPDRSATPTELVKRVYKETPARLHLVAECNLRLHLGKLVRDGLVTQEMDVFTAVEGASIATERTAAAAAAQDNKL